jgi:hypothetical protein
MPDRGGPGGAPGSDRRLALHPAASQTSQGLKAITISKKFDLYG